MRRFLAVVIAASSGAALAAPQTPAKPPVVTWADWVGDWHGALVWSGCAADGEPQATVSVDAKDGAVAIDLRHAGGALTEMPLVEEEAGWSGRQGDVAVTLARTARGQLALAIDLDSGCEIRGTLARRSVGILACDGLAAWARIESQCTKLTRPPLENPARLARQRATWHAARGPARKTLGSQCTARSAKVEAELVEVGCAPSREPGVGLAGECAALRGISARPSRCTSIAFDVRDALAREVVVLVAAAQGADKSTLPVVEGECRRAREKLFGIAQQAGCPP